MHAAYGHHTRVHHPVSGMQPAFGFKNAGHIFDGFVGGGKLVVVQGPDAPNQGDTGKQRLVRGENDNPSLS